MSTEPRRERNDQFAASLQVGDPTCENWAVVVAFYAALHYVESYFARFSVECHKHEQRDIEIKKDAKIRPLYKNYKFLFELSRTARYYVKGLPDQAYSRSRPSPHLEAIKKQIAFALAGSAKQS